jgi:hypothetical protein
MMDQTERDWLGLLRELIAALYEALSLQSEAVRSDGITVLRRCVVRIMISVMVAFSLLLAILFASMALSSLVAQHHGWPLALSLVALLHLLLAIAIIVVRALYARHNDPLFPRSTYVFSTLFKSMIPDSSQRDHDGKTA